MTSDYRFSFLIGLIGIVVGLTSFLFNYYMVPSSIWGYEIIVAPAMFTLSFFSEETYFIPKMTLFLFGQFIGYFLVSFILRKSYKFCLPKLS